MITVLGRDVAAVDPREAARTRAVMTQSNGVALGFWVREVVRMGRAPWHGRSESADDDAAVASAMAVADVAHLAGRPVQTLSGGEQARVTRARVLAQATPVILLDEPTVALDLRHQVDTLALLQARARDGATVLVVLHDLSLAAGAADHVVVLRDGRVAAARRARGRCSSRGSPGTRFRGGATPVSVTCDRNRGPCDRNRGPRDQNRGA